MKSISDDTVEHAVGAVPTADRYRDRIRARLAVTAKATDNLTVGIGMTTTENSDPRSGNQSLTGTFSKKAFDLDLAYFDWKFASWGNLIGGKMKQPFVKPGQSLFWDNDITPEGLALGFQSGMFFGTAYNYWLTETVRRREHPHRGHHAARCAARRAPADRQREQPDARGSLLRSERGGGPCAVLQRQREQQHDGIPSSAARTQHRGAACMTMKSST